MRRTIAAAAPTAAAVLAVRSPLEDGHRKQDAWAFRVRQTS